MLAVFTETEANTSAAPVRTIASDRIGRSRLRTLNDERLGARSRNRNSRRTQFYDTLTIDDTEREMSVACGNTDGVGAEPFRIRQNLARILSELVDYARSEDRRITGIANSDSNILAYIHNQPPSLIYHITI
jgi:hypothetical protein